MTTGITVGSLVKYTGRFLRNIGWFTDVPKDGKVTEVKAPYALVQWCDKPEGEVTRVRMENIMLADKPDYSNL